LLDALSVPLPATWRKERDQRSELVLKAQAIYETALAVSGFSSGPKTSNTPLKITQRSSLLIFIVCTFHSLIIPLYANIYVFICISEAWALLFDAQYLAWKSV
jgi:hypothetical protein